MAALRLECPPELPIAARSDELRRLIEAHQVVVVAGETGSGKSTQLPKICLAAGRGAPGGPMVGHTQPRRVAARTIAARLAEETGVRLGAEVGYSVRFDDRVEAGTRVRVMTDGVLLAELARDPMLSRYDTLIVDEAHERSLNIDFLLGYLHGLLARRADLKLVITSATIDTARFAAHFARPDGEPAPVVEISGRTHPVEVRYRPPADERDETAAIADAAAELLGPGGTSGDVLVFVSGEREIRDATEVLRARFADRPLEVLPLYARLSAAEQQRVFTPHGGRRIVVSTNVAETSVTVPGVRAVIDTGLARVSRYSRRLKVQRLPIEEISQASANQRAGRCGRLGPGICIRLYSEESFAERAEFTEPEILRTNLASVLLQMAAMGLGDPQRLGFIEAPDRAAWRDGEQLLVELGAIEADTGALTSLGRRLARLPVDPRLGRMILEAQRLDCVREVLVIAAALSIRDPREFPAERRAAAEQAHARHRVAGSDLLSTVALWDHLRTEQRARSSSAFRRMCRAEFLSVVRVREWQDLHRQLRRAAATVGVQVGSGTDDAHPDHVHRAVLSGHLSHVGMRTSTGREYAGARGSRFVVAPGSAVARSAAWVVAAELVETDRLRARRVAQIQPGWAEALGAHLVKRSYGEPRWEPRMRRAMVPERVTLYGLAVVEGRMVPAARADVAMARELYIRHGLLGDEPLVFVAANREVVQAAARAAARVRRHDPADPELLARFYDDRLPEHITSGPEADRWWRRAGEAERATLALTVADLLGEHAVSPTAYPDRWCCGPGLELDLEYRFDPGSPLDGVLVRIPIGLLDRVGAQGFDWHVRGHRPELVAALMRTLPKRIRRGLVPLGEHVAAVTERVMALDGPETGTPQPPLVEVLAGALKVHPDDFDPAALEPWLRMVFAVHGSDGGVLDAGRDLAAIRARQGAAVRAHILAEAPLAERDGITTWESVGTLPRRVDLASGARAYPTLVDHDDSVGLRLLTDAVRQESVMRAGVRRLLVLEVGPRRRSLLAGLDRSAQLALAGTGFEPGALADDAVVAAVDRLMGTGPLPWDADAYRRLADAVGPKVMGLAADALDAAVGAVALWAELVGRVDAMTAAALVPTAADAREHLDRLVRPRFMQTTGVHRLPDLMRWLRAVEHRLDRLAGAVERDRERMAEVRPLEARAAELRRAGRLPDDLVWALEELRVAVFAQPLGAQGRPSVARIERELARLSTIR